jgi:predicted nucleic acid-binding protein
MTNDTRTLEISSLKSQLLSRRRSMSVVVDADVLIALVVAEEHQAAASEHLARWLDADEELHAPTVLPYQVANVLARLVFTETLAPDEITPIWEDLAAFDLHLHRFDFTADGPAVLP